MRHLDSNQCFFCTTNINVVDYKDVEVLKRFLSSQAKIYPRKKSGLCAKHQRMLAESIKRARFLALVPYTTR